MRVTVNGDVPTPRSEWKIGDLIQGRTSGSIFLLVYQETDGAFAAMLMAPGINVGGLFTAGMVKPIRPRLEKNYRLYEGSITIRN